MSITNSIKDILSMTNEGISNGNILTGGASAAISPALTSGMLAGTTVSNIAKNLRESVVNIGRNITERLHGGKEDDNGVSFEGTSMQTGLHGVTSQFNPMQTMEQPVMGMQGTGMQGMQMPNMQTMEQPVMGMQGTGMQGMQMPNMQGMPGMQGMQMQGIQDGGFKVTIEMSDPSQFRNFVESMSPEEGSVEAPIIADHIGGRSESTFGNFFDKIKETIRDVAENDSLTSTIDVTEAEDDHDISLVNSISDQPLPGDMMPMRVAFAEPNTSGPDYDLNADNDGIELY